MKPVAPTFIFAAVAFLSINGRLSCRGAETLIAADDPRIQYVGRVDFSDPKSPTFDWSNVSISARFQGQGLTFLLQGSKNSFEVQVDGKICTNWVTDPGQAKYSVRGLSAGEHTLKVLKRTEALFGPTVFKGLALDDSVVLLEPPPRLKRKIEVIGDSWVCGYGNEADTIHCPDLFPFENADQTFGAMVARDLQAEVHLVAYSGRGVVRNYGEASQQSLEPFPKLFDRTLYSQSKNRWDFQQWIPDAVIIHLGVNDHSTQPQPKEKDFINGYVEFLKRIRAVYPNASIFCFTVDGWPDFGPRVASAIKTLGASGDKNIFQVSYPVVPQNEMGCDSHPNVSAHRKLADILKPVLKETLGW